MHRLLRLVTLWLIALALPIQGAAAATAMAMPASRAPMQHAMAHDRGTMAGMSMDAPHDAVPCPHHASSHATRPATHDAMHHPMDKSGCCGDCCGPVAWQAPALAVAPAAETWRQAARGTAPVVAPQFLTDGPERPPRPFLA